MLSMLLFTDVAGEDYGTRVFPEWAKILWDTAASFFIDTSKRETSFNCDHIDLSE